MKRILIFLLTASVCLSLFSCKKEESPALAGGNSNPGNDNFQGVVIESNITSDMTWKADTRYKIKGFVSVTDGVILTIEPGTVILGDKDSKGTLIIERGAKIHADGTASSPIVFTSAEAKGNRNYGDWGGIIMCGKAPVNLPGGEGLIEGGTGAIFGGNDPGDNSGVLRYVRIEFSGIAYQPNNEINGLTMGGMGSGTRLEYIQVSYCGDDAFEWFGGTVNARYLISHRTWDDDFDTDNGFSGNIQFGLVIRDPNIADQSGSNGFESDNDGQGTDAMPFTSPVFSNITVLGPLKEAGMRIDANYRRAVHVRRNSRQSIYNSVLAGFPTGLLIDGSKCENNANQANLNIKHTLIAGCPVDFAVGSGSTWDLAAWYNTSAFTNSLSADYSGLGITNAFHLTNPQLIPGSTSSLLAGADFSASQLTHPFFLSVNFRGAFGTTDWTSGWANFDPQNTDY